jgi:hypothetical protein
LGTGSADNIRASGILIPAQKAEDMTAPETRTEPKITLDQRASSRHDGATSKAAGGHEDILAAIERTAELRTRDVLTEAEFSAKKAELLARP